MSVAYLLCLTTVRAKLIFVSAVIFLLRKLLHKKWHILRFALGFPSYWKSLTKPKCVSRVLTTEENRLQHQVASNSLHGSSIQTSEKECATHCLHTFCLFPQRRLQPFQKKSRLGEEWCAILSWTVHLNYGLRPAHAPWPRLAQRHRSFSNHPTVEGKFFNNKYINVKPQ